MEPRSQHQVTHVPVLAVNQVILAVPGLDAAHLLLDAVVVVQAGLAGARVAHAGVSANDDIKFFALVQLHNCIRPFYLIIPLILLKIILQTILNICQ